MATAGYKDHKGDWMTGGDRLDSAFDSSLFASSGREKLRRALELAPVYYFRDLPRYVVSRRELGLAPWDGRALLNPLREFRRRVYAKLPLPPQYETALTQLRDSGARLAIPRLRLEGLLGVWWLTRTVSGDAIECGAYEGATSLLLALLGRLNDLDQRIHVLDTFEGSPRPSRFDGGHREGEFRPPAGRPEALARSARALGVADRLEIRVGLFSESFKTMTPLQPRFAFVHIDANLFGGTRDACLFTLPRICPGGAVVFDDYNGVCDLGARLAIDASLGRDGPAPRPLAWCSSYLRIPAAPAAGS